MWADIARYSPTFPSAVLSTVNPTGYPVSARCTPWLDQQRQVLRITRDQVEGVGEGPASLLFHTHDERLIKLRSFVVKGKLAPEDDGWCFQPSAFVPGQGIGLARGYVRLLRQGRANSRRYLAQRELTAPAVPWEEIRQLLRTARATGRGS
ncbi:hypothetical protein BH24ACT15_BH24ACT15_39280 [soil metagenome]